MDVMRTARWLDALQALLPPGQALSREPAANVTKLLEGAAAMLGDAEQSLDDWAVQYEPAVATFMLDDWERLLGLPDCCDAGVVRSTAQRRIDVLERLTVLGGQSRQYFIDLMARHGVTITIDELGNHVWRVNTAMVNLVEFCAGTAVAGDPLRQWGSVPMECRITRLKPAHTRALFGYPEAPGREMNFDFTAVQVSPLITSTGGLKRTFVDRTGVRMASAAAPRLDHNSVGRANNLKFSRNMANAANWLQNIGGWWTSQDSTEVPQPVLPRGQVVRVTKFTKVVAAPPDAVFARCNGISIPAGARSSSMYFYVPSGQGIASFKVRADWQDALGGTYVDSSVFDQWVRLESTGTTVSAATFLDWNITVNGFGNPAAGFRFYCAAPQESNALADFIATDESPVTAWDCRGLLNEPDVHNALRNTRMNGVVSGSPGTVPTNWVVGSTAGTFTRTVVGAGVENGIPYLDLRLQFTGASASGVAIAFDSTTAIVAAQGEIWTVSSYLKLVAGSTANLNAIIFVDEMTAAGAYLTEGSTSIASSLASTGAVLSEQRVFHTRTLTNASTGRIQVGLYFQNPFPSGAADITVRIGEPQAEKRPFAAFPVPTDTAVDTGTAATHLVSGANFTGYYNPAASTFVIDFTPYALTYNDVYWGIGHAGDFNNSVYLVNGGAGSLLYLIVYSGGANTVALNLGALVAGTRYKVAISMRAGEIAARCNGGPEQLSGGAMPLVVDTEALLCTPWNGGTSYPSAWMRQRQYWPRVHRAELLTLSTQ